MPWCIVYLVVRLTIPVDILNCCHFSRLFTIFGQCWVVGFKQCFTACTGCHALLHPIVLHSLAIGWYTGERFSWHDLEESIDSGVGERAMAVLEVVSDHLFKRKKIYWVRHQWHEREQQSYSARHDPRPGSTILISDPDRLYTSAETCCCRVQHFLTAALWAISGSCSGSKIKDL